MSSSDSNSDGEHSYLKKSVPFGVYEEFSLNGTNYRIYVEEDGLSFETVFLYNIDTGIEIDLQHNNAILGLERKDKWLGILSACAYDKYTDYSLIDLTKADTEDNHEYSIYISGLRGGWVEGHPSIDCTIDFEKELVTKANGRVKSFTDYFDPEVEKREKVADYLEFFNSNRQKNNFIGELLYNRKDEVLWKDNSYEKVKSLVENDAIKISLVCKGNVSGDDLTYSYKNSLFQPIPWEDKERFLYGGNGIAPIKGEPLVFLVPKILFHSFIKGIVEINLTWTIQFENLKGQDTVQLLIKQEMELMDSQPVLHQTRYNVDPNKPPLIQFS